MTEPISVAASSGLVRCDKYSCWLTPQKCVERQTVVNKPGGTQTWMQRPKFAFCASGECPQGPVYRELAAAGPTPALTLLRIAAPPPPVVVAPEVAAAVTTFRSAAIGISTGGGHG